MTTYKGINGFAVQSVASDPSPLDEGQVWYNNTSYAWKLAGVTTSGTWASGGSLTLQRYARTAVGIQTASLLVGGESNNVPGYGYSTQTDLYNGTSWTTSPGTTPAGRSRSGGAGTQTACIIFGGALGPPGDTTNNTISWNGSSWTSLPATLGTATYDAGSCGTQTAALNVAGGGSAPTYAPVSTTQSYNGSTWASAPPTGNYPNTNLTMASAGGAPSTAALIFGGFYGPSQSTTNITSSWNGTSWSAGGNLNTARGALGGAGASQTLALAFGGTTTGGTPYTTTTELYNGSTWTTNPSSMANAVQRNAGSGTQSLALSAGGYNANPATDNASLLCEEWTGPGSPVTKTITTS